jgi:anti-sigma B factor antagonist
VQITREPVENATVLRVEGWIDATTTKDFQSELNGAIAPGSERVVLDFSQVAYISSAGLRIVLEAAKQIRALRGGFAIFGAAQPVQRVFDISGFSRIIPMVASEAEALALVRG